MLAATALLVPAIAACQPAAPAAPANDGARRAEADNAPAASPAVAASPAASPFSGGIAVAGRQTGCHHRLASPAAKPPSPAAAAAASASTAMPTGDQKGSTSNPINMAFVPSADSQKVLASGEPLANC